MNLSDYAWATLQSITQKQPKDVKLLIDEIDYPRLETDSHGYVLKISSPVRQSDNLFKLHGMFFDADLKGKQSVWRMFKASVYHMCLHTLLTDFGYYKEISKGNYLNNVMFAASLVEDFVLRGYMRISLPGLLIDTAYANQLSALRIKNVANSDLAVKIAANLLSYSLIGRQMTPINGKLDKEIENVHTQLISLENEVASVTSKYSTIPGNPAQILSTEIRIASATKIIDLFENNAAHLADVYTPPFTDSHGSNDLFGNAPVDNESQTPIAISEALQELSIQGSEEKILDEAKSSAGEAQTVIGEWEQSLQVRQRIVEMLKEMDQRTHFENFLFPNEDYAEFVRTRSKLIGPIRRVLDQLRMVKTTNDEVQGRESGYVDIPLALQVLASGSMRNDVFLRDEADRRSEAWAIVVDLSKSLETFKGEMKSVLVALSEVARELIPNYESWASYAFNENLYVVKDFSERYSSSVKARIGGLPTGIKTYLPDAIRLAARRLSSTTEEVKVMLVASDGFPLGYDGIDEELEETIDEVAKTGIQMIGLGIGSSRAKRYFKSNCEINHPYDLMKHFVKTYLELASSF